MGLSIKVKGSVKGILERESHGEGKEACSSTLHLR
jgi:hypothetical protein